jgi:hypothetical protein
MSFNNTGSNRDQLIELREADRDNLLSQHVLVNDSRRQRPRWFDGRFLAARDLANEQNYFLVRQADLGRAGGTGVVEGLTVSQVNDANTKNLLLQIEPGEGMTDTGELVVLRDAVKFDPADVPEIQQLDAAFGLQVIPNEAGRSRTGLYILALRPVEWTANPIAAYPTSLAGPRTVQDGDIIEGTAVSLIQYPITGDPNLNRRRAEAAHEIFVNGRDRGLVSGTLPLAMVALQGNVVQWIDPYLVRRDAGAERPVGMDFGFGQRSLREAHLLQYDEHLAAAMTAAASQQFRATAWFDALPSAGRMPSNTLSLDFTQQYFPPGIGVQLAFVPEDEIPAILEESLLLPPIDLTLNAEDLAGTNVLVLASLPRSEYLASRNLLVGARQQLGSPAIRISAAASLLAASLVKPVQLGLGRVPRNAQAVWQDLLQKTLKKNVVWYVRQRDLPVPANVAPVSVDATSAENTDWARLSELAAKDKTLPDLLTRIRAIGRPEVAALVGQLAQIPMVKNLPLLKSNLYRALDAENAKSPQDVVAALAPVLDADAGTGLSDLAKADADFKNALKDEATAKTGLLSDVDKLARDVPEAKRGDLIKGLNPVIADKNKLSKALITLRNNLT